MQIYSLSSLLPFSFTTRAAVPADNYLIDKDGVLSVVPKIAGQPPADANIVELPTQKRRPSPED
jgi:hypothetical protein